MSFTPSPSSARVPRRSLLSKSSTNFHQSSPLASTSSSTSTSSSYSTPTASRFQPAGRASTPSSFSRGRAIPFDMAGSQRAAKMHVNSPAALNGTPIKPKRFIRKKPFLQKITDLPSTLIDRIDMNLDLLPIARPLGFALTALHFFLRAPLWSNANKSPSNILRAGGAKKGRWEGRWDTPEEGMTRTSIFHWTILLSIFLVLAATLNAVYLFTRTRSYRMHLRTDPLSSPNARKVPEEDPMAQAGGANAQSWMAAWVFAKRYLSPLPVARFLLSLPPKSASHEKKRRLVQQLDVWDPPAFNLQLFSTYTPPTALVLHFLTPSSPWVAILVALAVSFQCDFIVGKYAALIKDKELLAGEVMHEYDQKFVYPTIFKPMKDAATTTHEAETIW
ncbi:hypothetical protein BDY24DRAFT_384970 [Mrakia frigida]|uniref:Nur1/Mug154 family protein n=1 Tax=Mrakia frigida TaxID=29902 RepID=UPI003FCC129E